MSHQVLLLSFLQAYTSVIIPTSLCTQPHLVSFLISISFSLLLGELQTAVGPMTMIMRAEAFLAYLSLRLIGGLIVLVLTGEGNDR